MKLNWNENAEFIFSAANEIRRRAHDHLRDVQRMRQQVRKSLLRKVWTAKPKELSGDSRLGFFFPYRAECVAETGYLADKAGS